MDKPSLVEKVKKNLKLTDDSQDMVINDIVQLAGNYCNITDYPDGIEPVVRRKAKQVIDYEVQFGANTSVDVKSVKSGDTSITYNMDEGSAHDTIYNLTKADKVSLKAFRRVSR